MIIIMIIQTVHLISARRPGLIIVNKKKEHSLNIHHMIKLKENEKKDKYQNLGS